VVPKLEHGYANQSGGLFELPPGETAGGEVMGSAQRQVFNF
jgi:hypothetical protein